MECSVRHGDRGLFIEVSITGHTESVWRISRGGSIGVAAVMIPSCGLFTRSSLVTHSRARKDIPAMPERRSIPKDILKLDTSGAFSACIIHGSSTRVRINFAATVRQATLSRGTAGVGIAPADPLIKLLI